MDFAHTEIVMNIINCWVADKMRNMVKEVVTREKIAPDTRMLIVNSLYFRSRWSSPFMFNKDFSQPGFFYQTPITFVRTQFIISRSLVASTVIKERNSTLVSLPFIVKDHRMLIFFQNTKNRSNS